MRMFRQAKMLKFVHILSSLALMSESMLAILGKTAADFLTLPCLTWKGRFPKLPGKFTQSRV